MRRRLWALVLLLALASPTWAATPALAAPHCLTYEEKTLGRLQTLCADGTRVVSTYNRTLERWDTTLTPPPSSSKTKIDVRPKAPRR
jgi:hypothetical protein